MCADLRDCRFEYLDELIGDGAAYIKWVLHFRRPDNLLVSVRGVSHLQWREKIEFHEDVYDVGAMMYQQMPLLGNVLRWLRLRRAS